ncbi:MAG: hypothetical protein R3321_02235 [Nitrososphaeraceae archaeon]|nr:hypothetical protein [Nitrososphaeraceae archaeon]
MILVGIMSIVISFSIYAGLTNPYLNDSIFFTDSLFNLSIAVMLITFISSVAICLGIWKIYTINYLKKDLITYISEPFKKSKKYSLLIIPTAVGYGIVFCLLSQIFVYDPEMLISESNDHYPSVKIIPCCGTVGYVPMIYVYITPYFFMFLIPLNLLLVLIVSMLVGFNISLYIFSLKKIKEKRDGIIGGIGATCGLFIGCPTCAGTIIAAIFSVAVGTTSISALASFQILFISASIPILVITPFLIAKRMSRNIN